jgi:hypothetical protein
MLKRRMERLLLAIKLGEIHRIVGHATGGGDRVVASADHDRELKPNASQAA